MSLTSQKKNRVTFSIIVAIFFSVILFLGILMFNLFPFLANIYHTTFSQTELNCDCIHHFPFLSNHPSLGMFILSLSLMVVIFIIFVIFNFVRNILATKKFIKKTVRRKTEFPSRLQKVVTALNLKEKVLALDHDSSEVFCFGYFRPRICLSLKLVNQVSKSQLKAVLLHEKNHLKSFDPLKLFLVNTIKKSLFFIPGFQKLTDQFAISLELAADERATNNFQETKPLSKALIKIIELHQRSSNKSYNNVAVTLLNATEARIDRLINHQKQPQFNWFIPKLVISIIIVISLSVLLFNAPALLAKTTELNRVNGNINSPSCPMASDAKEHSDNNSSCGFSNEAHMSCASSDQLYSCY